MDRRVGLCCGTRATVSGLLRCCAGVVAWLRAMGPSLQRCILCVATKACRHSDDGTVYYCCCTQLENPAAAESVYQRILELGEPHQVGPTAVLIGYSEYSRGTLRILEPHQVGLADSGEQRPRHMLSHPPAAPICSLSTSSRPPLPACSTPSPAPPRRAAPDCALCREC